MTTRTATHFGKWILEALLALILVASAFAICSLYISQIRSNPLFAKVSPNDGTDMGTYDHIARQITEGRFLAGTGAESPLYPRVFLPLVYLVTGGDRLRTSLIQAALHAFNVLLIYIIAKRLFSRPTGLAAAVLAILYVPFIVYSAALLSETLLNTTILLTLLMLLDLKLRREETASGSDFLLVGISMGLAAAAKPTVLVFVPFALLWVFLHGRRAAKARLSGTALCVGGFLASLMPFILWGYVLTGSLVPLRGNSGEMFLMGNNPAATGAYCAKIGGEVGERFKKEGAGKSIAEQDRIAYRLAFEFMRENPGKFMRLLVRKLKLFWGYEEIGNNLSVTYYRQVSFLGYPPFLSFGLILPTAIVGAFLAIPRLRTVWILYAFVFVYSAAIVLFVVVGRYRLAVVPVLIIFAGHCLATLGRWIANRRFGAAAGAIAIMAILMVFIYCGYLWRTFYPTLERALAKRGYCWPALATGSSEFLIKDDTGRLSDYGVILKYPEAAGKTLLVPREILDRTERAFVIIHCAISADARWRLGLNGNFLDMPKAEGQADGVLGTITIPIKPAVLKEGENEIIVEPVAGSIKVALDDYYDFNRSAIRDAKGKWRDDRLDTETCKTVRSLHIADGEFMIQIKLETRNQIPAE